MKAIPSILAALCLYLFYQSFAVDFPYYYAWDMDLIESQDTIVIQGGQTPSHIIHPAYGINFVLVFSQKISHFLGSLSFLDFDQLKTALNPIVAMAEHSDYIRAHSPLIALGTVLLLWIAFSLLFKLSQWRSLGVLVLFGVLECFLIHSTYVRTEIYATFFWALALLLFALSLELKAKRSQLAATVFIGTALGFCFFSKIQSIMLLVSFPIFAFLLLGMRKEGFDRYLKLFSSKNKLLKYGLILSSINVAAFLSLMLVAHFIKIPDYLATFHRSWGVNFFFLAFLVAFGSPLVFFLLLKKKKVSDKALSFFVFVNLMLFGFTLFYLSHYFLYSSFRIGTKYLVYNMKNIFMKHSEFMQFGMFTGLFENLGNQFRMYSANVFSFLFLFAGLLYFVFRKKRLSIKDRRTHYALIGLGLIAWFVLARLTRSLGQDSVWVQTLLTTLSLIILFYAESFKWIRARVVGIAIAVLIVLNVAQNTRTRERIDQFGPMYSWDQERWFHNVYGGWTSLYRGIIDRIFIPGSAELSSMKSLALIHARESELTRRTYRFIAPDSSPDNLSIGVLAPGFPSDRADVSLRFRFVPGMIRGLSFAELYPVGESQPIYIRKDLDLYLLLRPKSLDQIRKKCKGRSLAAIRLKRVTIPHEKVEPTGSMESWIPFHLSGNCRLWSEALEWPVRVSYRVKS